MQQRRTRKKLMADINVVPYIDVMLVLLIIFMITAPLVTQGVKVELPQAASEPVPPNENNTPLQVTVDIDGNYYVEHGDNPKDPVDNETLITKVKGVMKYKPETPVLVGGDGSVPYEKVIQLMSLLQSAGVPSVGLLTKPIE